MDTPDCVKFQVHFLPFASTAALFSGKPASETPVSYPSLLPEIEAEFDKSGISKVGRSIVMSLRGHFQIFEISIPVGGAFPNAALLKTAMLEAVSRVRADDPSENVMVYDPVIGPDGSGRVAYSACLSQPEVAAIEKAFEVLDSLTPSTESVRSPRGVNISGKAMDEFCKALQSNLGRLHGVDRPAGLEP